MDGKALPEILQTRAENQPGDIGFVFLRDGERPEEHLTYGDLYRSARIIAASLTRDGLTGGNAVLLFPAGLEFIKALLGCHYAGVAGAPVKIPNRLSGLMRIRTVADDAGTNAVLTTSGTLRELRRAFGNAAELDGLRWIVTDTPWSTGGTDDPVRARRLPLPASDGLALLQYTSGSTREPSGVMITHQNFMQNAKEINDLWPLGRDGRVVSWLPTFHDMGLMFGVVLPLWVGVPAYLMAPEAFIRRPMRWLEAISQFRGTHAAAPNFAYELCTRTADPAAQLDLSSWRVAVNGAEPVRPSTLRRFASSFAAHGFDGRALCVGYGLAESTLKVCGWPGSEPPRELWVAKSALQEGQILVSEPGESAVALVSCGSPRLPTQVRLVAPGTGRECLPGRVGEIWVSGPSVAAGYWRKPERTTETFGARVTGGDPGECYLRTGDLGFLHEGELYVTGRLKDLVIHNGRNHYPQDLEGTVEASFPGLQPSCAAAFCVPGELTEELVIAVEADGRVLRQVSPADLTSIISVAVKEGHGITPADVAVVRRGTLPRTTSGKIRRQACRSGYLNGTLALAGRLPAEPRKDRLCRGSAVRGAGEHASWGLAPIVRLGSYRTMKSAGLSTQAMNGYASAAGSLAAVSRAATRPSSAWPPPLAARRSPPRASLPAKSDWSCWRRPPTCTRHRPRHRKWRGWSAPTRRVRPMFTRPVPDSATRWASPARL